MHVILLERVEKLGQIGDTVNVRDGYARNFLLPQGKALRASKANMAQFEGHRAQLEADNITRRTEADAVHSKLDGIAVTLIRQASESGQLYGSVNARDIATAVSDAGFTIDRRQVRLDRAIKALGLHPIKIVLHPEVTALVRANVAKSDDEAQLQLARGGAITDADREAEEDAAAAAERAATAALAFADDDAAVTESIDGLVEESVVERLTNTVESTGIEGDSEDSTGSTTP